MERATPPPDILELMRRARFGEQLSRDEINQLQFWASSNAANTDPAWISAISNAIQTSPGGTAGAIGYETTTGAPPDVRWSPDRETNWPQPAGSDETPTYTPPGEDWVGSRDAMFGLGAADEGSGGRRERRPGNPAGDPLYGGMANPGFGEGSAFTGLEAGSLRTVASNPDIAATLLAKKRGGSDWSGSLLSRPMAQALQLSSMGLLGGARGMADGGKRDLSSIPQSSADTLRRAENWLDQLDANNSMPDPSHFYRKAFRRVRNTDPSLLVDPEGRGDTLADQINVTTGALLDAAAAAGLEKAQYDWLQMRLGQASQEYVMGVATGEIDPATMSYPAWLRSEKQAQRWLGR